MDADLVTELFSVVGRFRRQLRRSTGGAGFDRSGLTHSQVELLRLVGRKPHISVREAAAELSLAANTASTLVSKLASDGLLIRAADDADRRICRLQLAAPAQRIADDSRHARRAAIAGVLDELAPAQIDDLTKGLTAIAELTRILQERQS